MAATIAQPTFGLQPPSNDDTMEISSDFGALDGDIDIDLDGVGEQMRYEDDDQMIDDVKSDRGNNPDDDVMLDDDVTSNHGDREMQEAAPNQEVDEDLLDFSDIETEDAPPLERPVPPQAELLVEPQIQPAACVSMSAPASVADEPIERVQSEAAAQLLTEGVDVIDHSGHEHQPTEQPHVTAPSAHNSGPQSSQQEEHELSETEHVEPENEVSHLEAPAYVPEDAAPAVAETVESTLQQSDEHAGPIPELTSSEVPQEPTLETVDETNAEAVALNTSEQPAAQSIGLSVDTEPIRAGETSEQDYTRERQHSSPTVTGLHSTVVEYDGNEIYLFPSREPQGSEQYLLENENLATTSLGDLLQACRSVLGESLSEDEELVMGVEELDLYISEDSTPAFSTSFSELLEAFVQLHRNDGNMHPPPFRVTLTTKTRFTNRLTLITQAVAEGKGFSQLSFLQQYHFDDEAGPPFPEEEDFVDDEDYNDDHQEVQVGTVDQLGPAPDEPASEATDEPQQLGTAEAEEYPDVHENAESNDSTDKTGDNHVSEPEVAQSEDHHTEVANESELFASAQDASDENSLESKDSHEEARDEGHLDDPSAAVAVKTVTEAEGEDDNIDFSDDEDDDSTLTTSPAPAEGDLQLTENEVSLGLDEVPAPQEDEHFDDEEYQEDTIHVNEATAGTSHISDAGPLVAAGAFNGTEESNVVAENEAGIFDDEEEAMYEEGPSMAADSSEQYSHVEHDTGLERDLNDEFAAEDSETATLESQNESSVQHEINGKALKAAHDPDEINFDDDEEVEDHVEEQPSTPIQEAVASDSDKTSPSIKRSFSQRNELQDAADDEQASKKTRSL